jgi:nucleotide-binding universal stress UspA family protein
VIPRSILVPIDFSASSEHALDYACELAAKLGATLHVVHALGATVNQFEAVFTSSMLESMRIGAQARLAKLLAPRRERVEIGKVIIQSNEPRDAILEAAKELGVELIVIGSHGRHGVSRLLLGSIAEGVARRAPCPVLVVHGGTPN